ncbi:MTAP family purine nucleoside phosphorylase [Magnetofaba australis]|uniref:Putative methylthioadenosine phosphorylase n=1 Tax=Magnetofaba australis IT-1 TaxID=1434232 RepID=A0A1Y2K5T9_9PROT|nr:MTAP family purine nucleoside phosphorylase [Magnetofaba australis]OSM05072.1 putative methylthioadenosine phosphorylase [Magnetofaba australis IT-1]
MGSTPAPIALIGGTSFLDSSMFRDAKRVDVETEYGAAALLDHDGLIFLQRHGLDGYTPPHRINHKANLAALKQYGAQRALAIGSVGSLQESILPGSFVLPDDFYAPHVNESIFDDARGHQPPGFDAPWRAQILEQWRAVNPNEPLRDGGVYWQTRGPRFETRAEIRAHQPHCDLVGMTVAAECILSRELGLPYAAIGIVDNFANGIGDEELTFDAFKAQVRANEQHLLAAMETLLPALRALDLS